MLAPLLAIEEITAVRDMVHGRGAQVLETADPVCCSLVFQAAGLLQLNFGGTASHVEWR